MRNDRGGVIILGVEDTDGVASAAPGVDLSDGEELRMRSIVAAGTAPHAAFEIQRVESADAGHGFYLLIAPPSSQRPHAVIHSQGLRYPRRDGAGTRYMSEVEIADMYRSRFAGEAS
jgi:predicted HTH transcriptional regulator